MNERKNQSLFQKQQQLNLWSQVEKQIVNSELKDIETGPGVDKTKKQPSHQPTVLRNSPASQKPSQNRFISLQNNLNQVLSLHKQIILLFLEVLIKMC